MIYTLVSPGRFFSMPLASIWHGITSVQVLPFLPDLFTRRLHVPERQGMLWGYSTGSYPFADVISSITMDQPVVRNFRDNYAFNQRSVSSF